MIRFIDDAGNVVGEFGRDQALMAAAIEGLSVHPDDQAVFLRCKMPALTKLQFDAVVRLLGLSYQLIENAIDAALANPAERAVAKSKLWWSPTYRRTDDLFAALGPVLGLDEQAIDFAWAMAAEIPA